MVILRAYIHVEVRVRKQHDDEPAATTRAIQRMYRIKRWMILTMLSGNLEMDALTCAMNGGLHGGRSRGTTAGSSAEVILKLASWDHIGCQKDNR